MPLQHIVRQKVTVNTTKEEEKILRVLAEQRQHQYARVPDWICYDYLPLQSAPAHAVSKALRRRGSCCTRRTREQQCQERWRLREKQKAAKKKNFSKREASSKKRRASAAGRIHTSAQRLTQRFFELDPNCTLSCQRRDTAYAVQMLNAETAGRMNRSSL